MIFFVENCALFSICITNFSSILLISTSFVIFVIRQIVLSKRLNAVEVLGFFSILVFLYVFVHEVILYVPQSYANELKNIQLKEDYEVVLDNLQ